MAPPGENRAGRCSSGHIIQVPFAYLKAPVEVGKHPGSEFRSELPVIDSDVLLPNPPNITPDTTLD